jgi:hypothetical protein
MLRRSAGLFLLAFMALTPMTAQERFSFFQASTPESVERMLTLARLKDDDVVVDLGSGNGLIPLTAARMNAKLRGWGVDIDPQLVDQSNQAARDQGVADRIRFYHRNAFDADLRDATVVTMWLFPELMRLLRPTILERARPGTRVLTSTWDLGTWPPDDLDDEEPRIHLWIVPARVGGAWQWDLNVAGKRLRYGAVADQHFQSVEGVARVGDRREVLEDMAIRGEDLSFALRITLEGLGLAQHAFTGKVRGDEIVGTATVTLPGQPPQPLPWRARRVARSNYFAPTGAVLLQRPASVIDATARGGR